MAEWLFQLPKARTYLELRQMLEQDLEAHPDAAAIADDEAEQFAAVAWGLRIATIDAISTACRGLGVPAPQRTEKGRRRAVLAILRTWPGRKQREALVQLPRMLNVRQLPDLSVSPDLLTGELLVQAWADGLPVVWVTQILRVFDCEDQIPALLEKMADSAEERRALIIAGKRLMKRVLWQSQAEGQAQAERHAQKRRLLAHRLQQQESTLRSLSTDVAEVARRRDDLRRAALGARENAQELLAQARSEVAAAEAELRERTDAHARELAELSAQHEARLLELSRRLDVLRNEQAGALRERGRRAGGPLAGLTFRVAGPAESGERYRTLLESAGGGVVKENAVVNLVLGAAAEGQWMTAGTGLADLERLIRQQVLPRLLELRAGRL